MVCIYGDSAVLISGFPLHYCIYDMERSHGCGERARFEEAVVLPI